MKIFSKKILKNRNGITLIALVVSIIVLLILAGISIEMLSGDNGVLRQASNAKEKTDIAGEKEGVELATLSANVSENGFEELNQENLQKAINTQFGNNKAVVIDNGDGSFTVKFTGRWYEITSSGRIEESINWDLAKQNAKAPIVQNDERNNGVIGIGIDGKPVNMDLWEYTLLNDGTYGLNDSQVYNNKEMGGNNESNIYNTGYIGQYDSGKIEGTIPQYISTDNGNTWKAVTSLYSTFINVTELTTAPIIPKTITNMQNTFFGCTSLYKIDSIPDNIISLAGTFYNCTSLVNAPNIGKNVKDMSNTFAKTSIKNAPTLPEGITNMSYTFANSKLEKIDTIPNSVTNMQCTFKSCENLTYVEKISTNVTNLVETFNGCINLSSINFVINNKTKNIRACFQGCKKISGKLQIDASITNDNTDNYKWIFNNSAASEGSGLNVTGTSEILNNLKSIYTSNSKISFNI